MLLAILQGIKTIANSNIQANRNQNTQMIDGSDQNHSYRKDLSNIWCFICEKMGHYARFHEKSSPPPVTIYAGPVHARGALPANMVLVMEDYYLPEIEDTTLLAPAIPKKGVQKATGMRLKTRLNTRRLQHVVDQGFLDDNDDGQLTPIEDMDELENASPLVQIPHVIASISPILKPNHHPT